MGSSKVPKRKPSKRSCAAAPSTSASTQISSKSSILRSLFSPPEIPGCYFASVIQGIDSQHLRIHDATSGLLRCEHAIETKLIITSLDWGYYDFQPSEKERAESRKKRKRSTNSSEEASHQLQGEVVIAFGTSDSYVQFLSISGKVLGTLRNVHTQGIRDFKFVGLGRTGKGWSVGGEGKLVQWNVKEGKCISSRSVPEPSVNLIFPWKEDILCASQTAYLISTEKGDEPTPFAASSHSIRSIATDGFSFLCSSESERFINVFDVEKGLIGTLRADADVVSISLLSYLQDGPTKKHQEQPSNTIPINHTVLSTVNKEGMLEIFTNPFGFDVTLSQEEGISRKARLARKTKRASATLKLRRPDKTKSVVPLIDASIRSEFILVAWAEGGFDVKFEQVRWRNPGSSEVLLTGNEEIFKAKPGLAHTDATVSGVKSMGKTYVDESRAVVGGDAAIEDERTRVDGADPTSAIEVSSAEDSESVFESDSEPEPKSSRTTGFDEDFQMEDASAVPSVRKDLAIASDREAEKVDASGPSFGDLLRKREPGMIDVQALVPDQHHQAIARAEAPGLQKSSVSLGIALSQSLRTSDVSLLESCLHTTDSATIRTTVERLDSSLASVLCQRLAERIQSRPGRAGSLVTWIECTVITHGGYLVGQQNLMKSVRSLVRVLRERTSALQTFLSINGKLDIIAAQVDYRRAAMERTKAIRATNEDDEDAVIYVEGQEESDSEDGNEDLPRMITSQKDDFEPFDDDADIEMDEEAEPTRRLTNGDLSDEVDSDGSEGAGFIDYEAESTDQDSDSASVDDVDDPDSDEDSESQPSIDEHEATSSPRPIKKRLTNGIKHHPS